MKDIDKITLNAHITTPIMLITEPKMVIKI